VIFDFEGSSADEETDPFLFNYDAFGNLDGEMIGSTLSSLLVHRNRTLYQNRTLSAACLKYSMLNYNHL